MLAALLEMYADEGVRSIETTKVLRLKPFSDIGTPIEIVNEVFGGKDKYEQAIAELEQELFRQEESA